MMKTKSVVKKNGRRTEISIPGTVVVFEGDVVFVNGCPVKGSQLKERLWKVEAVLDIAGWRDVEIRSFYPWDGVEVKVDGVEVPRAQISQELRDALYDLGEVVYDRYFMRGRR